MNLEKNSDPLAEDLALLKDIHRGLTDVEEGRVVPHDEARARLLARYEEERPTEPGPTGRQNPAQG